MKKTPLNITPWEQTKFRIWRLKTSIPAFMKRTSDITLASLALLAISPALGLIATLIKLESSGPVFFKQRRVGLNGKLFTMWKFRSMSVDAEQNLASLQSENEMQDGVIFKMKKDPRITRIGSLIRKASIDELPQLLNVISGDMSIVGPRPSLPCEATQYELNDRKRLIAKPGITCIWQISGRSEIPFKQQVEMDINYIHNQSLICDLSIMIKTIPAVISARGAY